MNLIALTSPSACPTHPIEAFSVDKDHDIFDFSKKYLTTTYKIAKIAWDIFSVIIFPIGLCRLLFSWVEKIAVKYVLMPATQFNKEDLDTIRFKIFAADTDISNLKITTIDNVELDGIAIYYPGKKPPNEQKWVIYLGGNGECYEGAYDAIRTLGQNLKTNVMHVNYRGVGASQGFPTSAFDIHLDIEAMIQFLLDKGVKIENIALIGHSIGGAFGTTVASKHHQRHEWINFVNDRSFSYLENEKDAICDIIANTHLQGECFYTSILRCIQVIANAFIHMRGWNINPADEIEHLSPDHTTIIYHKQDQIIPHPQASFAHVVTTKHGHRNLDVREIKGISNPHNSDLSENPVFYRSYCARIKKQLNIS